MIDIIAQVWRLVKYFVRLANILLTDWSIRPIISDMLIDPVHNTNIIIPLIGGLSI
jgi:hypothetical protein